MRPWTPTRRLFPALLCASLEPSGHFPQLDGVHYLSALRTLFFNNARSASLSLAVVVHDVSSKSNISPCIILTNVDIGNKLLAIPFQLLAPRARPRDIHLALGNGQLKVRQISEKRVP